MLKNKDGSYNKFPLFIISLIILISICVIGIFITENVNLPELHIPTFVETSVQKNNSSNPSLYNVNEIYFNYSNQTLTSSTKYDGDNYTWVIPYSTTNTTYFYVGGGGGGEINGGGIGMSNINYSTGPNTTYFYVSGGGGGTGGSNKSHSAKIASPVQDINGTVAGYAYQTDKINTTNNSYDLSITNLQNIPSVITYVMSVTLGNWFLIVMFFIMLLIMRSRQALFGIFIIIAFAYFFNFITFPITIILVSLIITVYIFMTGCIFDE